MRTFVIAGAVLTLLLPATASAQAPTVSTGGATAVEQTTATVRGKVNPRRNNGVVAFFQYGGTRLYGSQTPEIPLPAVNRARSVSAALTGLAPFTTYNYRIVSRDGNRFRFGENRTFRTDRQPLGLSLTASPTSVKPGGSTVLSGNLSGTGNAGRQVELQSQAFGTPGFTDAANRQIVDEAGNFAFPILSVPVNTAYKVVLPSRPEVVSPIVFVTVPLRATFKAPNKVRKGKRVKFRGTVSPSSPGALVEIQERFRGAYVTVATTTVGSEGTGFRRRIKVRQTGTFRAIVTPQVNGQPGGPYVADTTGTERVKVRR